MLEAYELEIADPSTRLKTVFRISCLRRARSNSRRLSEAQARLAAGDAFADVAGEFSDDIGSAAKGGDLGYTSGDAFPERWRRRSPSLS